MDEASAAPRTPPYWLARLLLAAAAILLVVLGYYTLNYFGERQAVRATEALGGRVHYNDGDPRQSVGPSGVGGHLRAMTGRIEPVWLVLSGQRVGDDAVDDCILPLGSLTLVGLQDVNVSNAALERLAALENLQSLRCTRDARNENLLNALASPTRIDMIDMPPIEAMSYLADFHGVPFRVDKAALRAAGIEPDTATLTYTTPPQVELEEALTALVGPAGMGWYLDAGEIVISDAKTAAARRAHVETLRRALPKLQSLQVD